ncbi:MAG: TadE/TadG family type IV pilus assembly protein [Acidobacteriota bacterium]|nr:pilus assembly protein [Blastocatellia bacterium]MDW8238469.1 TadE/TadG family type IV pilus assembly protein [Acidobacteriota bacterium]
MQATNRKKSQQRHAETGGALIELSLLLPIILIILVGLVEVGNGLNAYLTVAEASRDGARLIVREGPTANLNGLVQTLAERLPTSTLTSQATYGFDSRGNRTVTVVVNYDYRFIFGNIPLVSELLPNPLRLRGTSTMPIP